MSNEELVAHIQSGSGEYMEALWWQVEGFIKSRAAAVLSPGVVFDDLYNSGFIALSKAAQTYRAGEGMSFISWLAYYLKNEFASAAGYRTKKARTLNRCVSLDAPLGDEGDTTLGDLIPDPSDQYADAEARIYSSQLRAALEELIPATDRGKLIRRHYFEGWTLEDIAREEGVESFRLRREHDKALGEIRQTVTRTAAGERLRSFIDENTRFYRRVSAREFFNTHTSAVEKTVLERERMEGGATLGRKADR